MVFKIECNDAERLRRQLSREKNPNVEEIIRRYSTDKIDFQTLKLPEFCDTKDGIIGTFSPAFKFTCLKNETLEDRQDAVQMILDKIK